MSELWSAQQREWLQAMGHTVLALVGTEGAVESAPAVNEREQGSRAEAGRAGDSGARNSPNRSGTARADADRADSARPAHNAASGDSPLLRNLLRAARRPSGDPAVLELFDAQTLRGNAAAKRALWPRLRALRRGSASR